MGLRSRFFGSRLPSAITVLLGLDFLTGGVVVTGVLGASSVVAVDTSFAGVNDTTTTTTTDV